MNKWSSIGILLAAVVLSFGLVGCSGDDGPAGPPGTASCMGCHTDNFDDELATFLRPYQQAFASSKHNLGGTFERNTVPCSRCHTSEGFQHYVNTGEVVAVSSSSSIHCFTCHAPHTNENFMVRVLDPVAIDIGGTYDKGASNTCVTCHQARVPSPAIAGGGEVTSRRWGPHHGPQSILLTVEGFYSFDGGSYTTAHPHNSISDGCVNCHMAESPDRAPLVGGHSFWIREEGDDEININGCSCHSFDDEEAGYVYVEEWWTEFHAAFDALTADMETLGWINSQATNGFVNPATFTEQQLGAIWNWVVLEEDLSKGVHNPSGALAVIAATQAFVDTQSPSGSIASNQNMKTK